MQSPPINECSHAYPLRGPLAAHVSKWSFEWYRITPDTETWQSGLLRSPAKGVAERSTGSNPVVSANASLTQMVECLFEAQDAAVQVRWEAPRVASIMVVWWVFTPSGFGSSPK